MGLIARLNPEPEVIMYDFTNFATNNKADELKKLVEVLGEDYVPVDVRADARCEQLRNEALARAQQILVHEIAPAFRDAGIRIPELSIDKDRYTSRVIPGFDLSISGHVTLILDYECGVEDTYVSATLVVSTKDGQHKTQVRIVAIGFKTGKNFSIAAKDRAHEISADAEHYDALTRGLVMKIFTEARKSLGWSDED